MARVEPGFRVFFVFPFTHAEDAADQALSMALSARIDPGRAERVSGHRDIIPRFGRFPHRNPLLGRRPTADEAAYLGEGGLAGRGEVVPATPAGTGTRPGPVSGRPSGSGPRRPPWATGRRAHAAARGSPLPPPQPTRPPPA